MQFAGDLLAKSLEVIKHGQAENGAFPAAAHFSAYQYCWLRDGTFVAYAADLAGMQDVALRFYRWVHRAVGQHLDKLERVLQRKELGLQLSAEDFLHTRYTLTGTEGTEPWGNFQMDGYGTYLFGVAEHIRLTGDCSLWEETEGSIKAVVRYLLAFWDRPNFDCWEENGDQVHPSTLAGIYGGLQAIAPYVQNEHGASIVAACRQMRELVERQAVVNGRFCKSIGNQAVDANLLWLAVPFGFFAKDDARMVRTVEAIENELVTGGVHRYPQDTFYGGGAWVLLTAWLGWYYAEMGQQARAEQLLQWVEDQADVQGFLPEQVPEGLLHPQQYRTWFNQWGEPAKPLLWSHALHVVLRHALGKM